MSWTVQGSLQGPKGDQGDPGADGAGIAIAGSVATYGDLPNDLTADDAGDGYLVEADGLLYIWSGTAFPADGSGVAFQGPAGPANTLTIGTVTTGSAGGSASATLSGSAPNQTLDMTIPRGNTGTTGPRGATWFTGHGEPTTVAGSTTGDLYLDVDTGNVYTLS